MDYLCVLKRVSWDFKILLLIKLASILELHHCIAFLEVASESKRKNIS